jgi:UDP:flavonoid glycosyltransferase YjiC (YdhE family)
VRVLLSSTGGAGHFGPLRPFIEALARRGVELLIVVPPQLEATVSATGHPFVLGADPPADELAAPWERFSAASGQEAAILANRELFGRLWTAAMLPAAEQACREWRPGLVLHEAAEYASASRMRRSRSRWPTSRPPRSIWPPPCWRHTGSASWTGCARPRT